MPTDQVGSAVLVHGMWGNPEDWRWVRRLLEDQGVQVVAPDLPSHRSATAGAGEDAEAVRSAIHACPSPVVVVGWSYGCSVISAAADGEDVRRLVYVSDIPVPAEDSDHSLSWIQEDPHIAMNEDGTFVVDNDWLLSDGEGLSLPTEVQDHLRRNPRRPASTATHHRQQAAAWETIPTTVILGTQDDFYTEADHKKAAKRFDDFQPIDSDHFVIFRRPEVVATAVLKAVGL